MNTLLFSISKFFGHLVPGYFTSMMEKSALQKNFLRALAFPLLFTKEIFASAVLDTLLLFPNVSSRTSNISGHMSPGLWVLTRDVRPATFDIQLKDFNYS